MNNIVLNDVIESIKNRNSFVLEAWAGSGKTHTLVESIRYLINEKWDILQTNWQKIGCITYTNVAKDEMIKRLDYNEIVKVNTIHEFLWDLISSYQFNLKKEITEFNSNLDLDKRIDNIDTIIKDLTIVYWKYWTRLMKWELWHSEVISFSINMLNKYNKLRKILIKKYPYLFIDEYQDTFKEVVNILLDILNWNEEKFLLWFFWDSMQKIYQDNRIWKIITDKLKIIEKIENYRSWKNIVNVINKIREKGDWLKQVAVNQIDWEVTFYYSNDLNNEEKYKLIKEKLGRDFIGNPKENKILVLTNKKISEDLWYLNLVNLFENRYSRYWIDRLKDLDEPYINFLLTKLEKLFYYYNNKDYYNFYELFSENDFKIDKLSDIKKFKAMIDDLNKKRSSLTIKDVLDFIFTNKIFNKTNNILSIEEYLLSDFEEGGEDYTKQQKIRNFQEWLFRLFYKEVIEYFKYIEEMTPYSTQHWSKWAEYDNVLMIIDDSHKWYMYRGYDKLVSGKKLNKDDDKHLEAEERLLNLLYVSTSRAKKHLSLLYLSSLDEDSKNWWKSIFWEENVKIIE